LFWTVRGIAIIGGIVMRFEKNSHPSPKTVNIGSTGGMARRSKEGQMAGDVQRLTATIQLSWTIPRSTNAVVSYLRRR
jgi:hypothetical protein